MFSISAFKFLVCKRREICFLTSEILFFQKRLCCLFLFDCRRAFAADIVFGISPAYDNILHCMVKSDFLMKTQNTILSAAFVLALSAGLNAGLGFVKSRLLAGHFGVSEELSIFYTADRIPNLIYSVLVIGALSTIFIPIFNGLYKKNKDSAWKAASSIINASVLFFMIMGGIIFIFAPQIMQVLSVNKFTPEQIQLGASLMRIMLAGQFILIISSFLTSLLQSFKYFLIPAVAPVIYSLGMIIGIVFLSPTLGIYGPTWGVILGAVLHLAIQLPLLKKIDLKYAFIMDLKDKGIREMCVLMPPRILSVLIANVLYTLNNSLAILISTPSVIFLKFASQLQFFPVNLFGISIASAALPTLSLESEDTEEIDLDTKAVSGKNNSKDPLEKFKKTFVTSFLQMMYLVIPAGIMMLVLRVPIVRLVYGVENFPWYATLETARTLGFFSLSIFAQSAIYLITRAFYSLKDTVTPVKVSLVTIFINVLLSLVFIYIFGWGVWSIALSFSITSIIDMSVMFWLLSRKVGGFELGKLFVSFSKIALSGASMALSLYLFMKLLDLTVLDTSRTINLVVLCGISTGAGFVSYFAFTKLFQVEEVVILYKLAKKFRIKGLMAEEKPSVIQEKSVE